MPSCDAPRPFVPLGGPHAAEPFRPFGARDDAPAPESSAAPAPDPLAEAFAAGHARGLTDARVEQATLAADVAALADTIGAWRDETRTRYTARLVDLALAIARRIVGDELELHPERWTDIVAAGVRELVEREPVVVRVAPRLATVLMGHLPRLGDPTRDVRVIEDGTLAAGDCRLETPSGDLDCGIDAQWAAIADALRGGA
jgi:flagellar assembly protein FliH